MKKPFSTKWYLVGLTLIFSVAGFALRRCELSSEGTSANSSLFALLTALLGIYLVTIIILLLPLQQEKRVETLFTPAYVPNILQLLCALLLIFGNALGIKNGTPATVGVLSKLPEFSEAFAELMPILGLLTAVCIAAFAVLRLMKRKPTELLYMIASVYLIVRLIVSFQQWNIDPSIYDYAFSLFAAICCMLGCFQLAGFCFDRGKRRISLFWTLLATVFSSVSLADVLKDGTIATLCIHAALLLTMAVSSAQLLLAKLPETPTEPEAAPQAASSDGTEQH